LVQVPSCARWYVTCFKQTLWFGLVASFEQQDCPGGIFRTAVATSICLFLTSDASSLDIAGWFKDSTPHLSFQ
jgi:hypothetical protein